MSIKEIAQGGGFLKGKGGAKGAKDLPKEIASEEDNVAEDAGNAETTESDAAAADKVAKETVNQTKAAAAEVVKELTEQPPEPAAEPKPAPEPKPEPKPAPKPAASETVNPAPRKEKAMDIAISFDDLKEVEAALYALVTKSEVAPVISKIAIAAIELDPDTKATAKAIINRLPQYGRRYRAVKILKNAIFDTRAEAEQAASDVLKYAKFEDVFEIVLFYKDESGAWGDPIPEGSEDYESIRKAEKAANPPKKGKA